MAMKQTRRASEQEDVGAVMKMNELSDEVAEEKNGRNWMQWVTRVGRRNWIITAPTSSCSFARLVCLIAIFPSSLQIPWGSFLCYTAIICGRLSE